MPVTRFQTDFSRGRGRGGRRPGRAPLPPALPIPGYAGFRYDTQHLSPVSAERAAEGIEAGFILHSLKSMTDGRDRYIAFQLHVPVAIRIYDPVIQQLQPIRVVRWHSARKLAFPEFLECMDCNRVRIEFLSPNEKA